MVDQHIQKLDSASLTVAEAIVELRHDAYSAEAGLLGVTDFPPLNIGVDDILTSHSDFYAYVDAGSLLAAIELSVRRNEYSIDSIVVKSGFHRRGMGRNLINYVRQLAGSSAMVVETAANNFPAVQLFESCGFRISERRSTPEKIDLVRMTLPAGRHVSPRSA